MTARIARQVVLAAALCSPGALSGPASAGPVELEFLLFEIDYGVYADGGSQPTPLQGPVYVDEEGEHAFAWSQEDGVAFAEATATAVLEIDEDESGLVLGGSLATTASAVVGDDPDYPFETGIAQSFLSQLLFSISVDEQSVLSVVHSPVDLVGVGTIEPGGQHLLDPGLYDLTYPGGFDTGSSVSVGANERAYDENEWSFGLEVVVVPAPGGALAALLLIAWARRRR